jgi:glycosyltransferase involved in cell wall biosynthesis
MAARVEELWIDGTAPVARPQRFATRRVQAAMVSVVIPTRNEAANIPYVLAGLTDMDEVIVVDGGSTDGTSDVARAIRPDVVLIEQTGSGKGNALACGFRAARGDIVVMLDADASMDTAEIPALVEAIAAGPFTFAKGSRLMARGGSEDLTRIRRLGNRALVGLVNLLYGTRFTDLCYGYIAFWRRDLDALGFGAGLDATEKAARRMRSMGFEVETILNVRAARAGLNVVEVPSFERSRLHGTSNLNVVRDGLRVLRTIIVERFRRTPSRQTTVRSLRPVSALAAAGD